MVCVVCHKDKPTRGGMCEDCEAEAKRPQIGHLIAGFGDFNHKKYNAAFYEVIMARNGLWVRGEKPGLKVQFPIHETTIFGALHTLKPEFEHALPPVPVGLLLDMWRRSIEEGMRGLEVLFYLSWNAGAWELSEPPQQQEPARVVGLSPEMRALALIEVHSHHVYQARFSSVDDNDEQGFRIYAVLGDLWTKNPKIRVRVGLHGHRYEIPASQVFELPDGLADAMEG